MLVIFSIFILKGTAFANGGLNFGLEAQEPPVPLFSG